MTSIESYKPSSRVIAIARRQGMVSTVDSPPFATQHRNQFNLCLHNQSLSGLPIRTNILHARLSGSATMGTLSKVNISKEEMTQIYDAPIPEPATILQTRIGKTKENALGHGDIFASAIFKEEHHGLIFVDESGLAGDEHVSPAHGGHERAVHQYDPNHYADWRAEAPPEPELYSIGAFGENISTTIMTETNVCIGDTFRVGTEVLLQITEPRHPCYKLNARFQWTRALKRVLRTGRPGWNYRVLRTGLICKGDVVQLVNRPFPQWSLMNIQRAVRAKRVPLHLMSECAALPMTTIWLDLVKDRLRNAPKTYVLTQAMYVSPRIRKLTFSLKDPLTLDNPSFEPYTFAQIKFGPDLSLSRSYSIVEGDIFEFSLGVALDDQSRGGSAYIHRQLKIGDKIEMSPGANPKGIADDRICETECNVADRIVLVGGIGVTAFLPSIREWENTGTAYHVHYAVRSPEEAAFLDVLGPSKTTLYAKSDNNRLDINAVIPEPSAQGEYTSRLYFCGPSRMMQASKQRASELGYPEHMVHSEDFGGGAEGSSLEDSFEAEVDDPDAGRHETLVVPSGKSLLDVLNDAGFGILYSCKSGICGACKVTVCSGRINFKSQVLTVKEKETAMQSCVDRGVGKIKIEID